MRKLALFLIVGALASCASTPPNPWLEIDVSETPAATAVDCGSMPLPSEVVGDSIIYDNAGVNDLEAYRVCAEANEAIVTEHAAQIGALKRSRTALVSAGASQRRIADMRAEMLKEERRSHLFQSIGLYAIIIGLVL